MVVKDQLKSFLTNLLSSLLFVAVIILCGKNDSLNAIWRNEISVKDVRSTLICSFENFVCKFVQISKKCWN